MQVAQDDPTEVPTAAAAPEPVPLPASALPEEMMDILPVEEEPAQHAQPITSEVPRSPSPGPQPTADYQNKDAVTPEADVVTVLEAIAARGGSPPWNVAPTEKPAGEPVCTATALSLRSFLDVVEKGAGQEAFPQATGRP